MLRASSLSKYFVWHRVAELLDLPVERQTLPAALPCPACRARQLYVYHDAVFDGEWLHCRQCDYHGDIVDLASRTWKLDLGHTVLKLLSAPQTRTVDDLPENRLAAHLHLAEWRAKIDKFWAACQKLLDQTDDAVLHDLLIRHGILRASLATIWRQTGAKFIGLATRQQVEQTFRTRVHHRHNVLKGQYGWKHVLVMPFYDAPGRICGFLFLGQDDKGKDVQTYQQIFPNQPDAGVGMLPSLLTHVAGNHASRVYHFNDVRMALRLQMRWLRASQKLMPIVLFRPETTGQIWQTMSQREHIVCGDQLTVGLLQHARRIHGKLSIYRQPRPGGFEPTSDQFLQSVHLQARPWRSLLELQLRQLEVEQCDALLLDLKLTRSELVQFVETCDAQLARKLQQVILKQNAVREARVRQRVITEDQHGWNIKGVTIVEGLLRIEQIVRHADMSYYRCAVHIRGQTVTFVERATAVKRRGLLCLAAEHAANAGLTLTYNPSWNGAAERIALLMHPPPTIVGATRIGWDPNLNGMRLAHFNLHGSGQVTYDTQQLLLDAWAPTQTLLPPMHLPARVLYNIVGHGPGNAFFWAALVKTIQSVLAPVWQQPATATVIRGIAADKHFRQFAAALGSSVAKATERTIKVMTRHHWPAILHIPLYQFNPEKLVGITNCLAVIHEPLSNYAILAGWDELTIPEDATPIRTSAAELQLLLPLYLQDLCQRNWNPQGHDFQELLADVADWVLRTWDYTLRTSEVLACHRSSDPTRRSEQLRKLLQQALRPKAVFREGSVTFLSQQGAQQANYPLGYKLTVYEATLMLQAAGALCQDVSREGHWAVATNWWRA